MNKTIYLSHTLNQDTPTYGDRNRFLCEKKSDILTGDVVNDSFISTTVHIGTHIDMPYHFYEKGQTIESFDANFFSFENILFVELEPKDLIINEDLIQQLDVIENKEKYEILVVKTGICHKRHKEVFWKYNYGFTPEIANYLRAFFPTVRVFGFDSISVSSFVHRMLGREAHYAFLDPTQPILLLEDMDLRQLNKKQKITSLTVAPLRIEKCDGLPCTVIARCEGD